MRLQSGQYLGSSLKVTRVADLVIVETQYEAGCRLNRHTHERPHFCFVLEGCFAERSRAADHTFAEWSLLFDAAATMHTNQFLAPRTRCLNIELGASWTDMLPARSASDPRSPIGGTTGAQAARRLYRALCGRDQLDSLAAEGSVLELLWLAEQRTSHHMPAEWLRRGIAYLHDSFLSSFSLRDVADAAGVHPSHFARAFRTQTGHTAGDYVRRLRVRHACDLLANSDSPISVVALSTGFVDQAHLTRVFRRHVGVTPARYRSAHRILPRFG